MSSNHLLKASTGCPNKSKIIYKMKKSNPHQVEAYRGYPQNRLHRNKRRKMQFHGSPRHLMILLGKRLQSPQNNNKFHGSLSNNRRTKKTMIGWSHKTAMYLKKKTGFLGVHNSRNSSNKETSLSRCSRKRKTKTTNISTTNLMAAKGILTVRKSWTPRLLSLILHIRDPSRKVIIQVRAHVLLHNKTRHNRLMVILQVKEKWLNLSNNLSRESAWGALKVNKIIWWTKTLSDKAISGTRLTIYQFPPVSQKLSKNYLRQRWLKEMPVELRRRNKNLWRFKHQEKCRRSSFLKGKRRTGAFLKERQPQRSTMPTTSGSRLPRKTKSNSKNHKLILQLIEAVRQLPNCRGRSRIRNSSLRIRTTNLHILKIQIKTATISRTLTSGWPMRTSSQIQWRDHKVLLRRVMLLRDLSWREVPEKLVVSAKMRWIKHQSGKLPVSKKA